MRALIVKEFKQLRRDKRTLALMVAMPLVQLIVFGYAASFDVDEVKAIAVGPFAELVPDQLPDFFEIERTSPGEGKVEATEALRNDEADVAFVTGEAPEALVDGSQLFSARAAVAALRQVPDGPPVNVLFNPELKTSVVLVPALAGMILVFIGTMVTSLGVVRERQAGTLEQLAVMPFRPADVFVGKITPYFVITLVDLAAVITLGKILFDVPFRGSVLLFGLGAILFLFVTLGLGVLISTLSENQGQAIQLSMFTLLPQVLLSGIIFPVETMPDGIRWIARILPLTYFNEISRAILVRGAGFGAVLRPMVILGVLGLVIFTLSMIRFQKDLAPSGRPARRAEAVPT
jgi:ABC-2 type transport system permease protein